jgi:acyl-CoA synthetase (AMP-forming)/AMP-acid ligase II
MVDLMGRQSDHLAGRVAIVSGVARPPGVGRATALRLATAGAHVVCAELVGGHGGTPDTGSAPRLLFDRVVDEVRAAGPGEVLAVPMAGPGGWDALAAAAVDRFGGLDICCALNGATGAGAGDGPLLIGSERVTVAQGVPTQWELMLRHPDLPATDTANLRLAATGGSRVPMDLIARIRRHLGVPVINRYASTEAAVISGTWPGDPDRVVFERVGRAGDGIELRVVDDGGAPVPPGEVGRVQVRSAAVMRGYWRDPQATAAAISPEDWLTVGDLGTFTEDGNLRVVGRIGESFVRGGYNIYPIEVEQALAEHPGVVQASVVPRPDSVLVEAGVAFVVMAYPVDPEELKAWVRDRLAGYKAPDDVVVVGELPLTPVGKVDRRALAARTAELVR